MRFVPLAEEVFEYKAVVAYSVRRWKGGVWYTGVICYFLKIAAMSPCVWLGQQESCCEGWVIVVRTTWFNFTGVSRAVTRVWCCVISWSALWSEFEVHAKLRSVIWLAHDIEWRWHNACLSSEAISLGYLHTYGLVWEQWRAGLQYGIVITGLQICALQLILLELF